jgi:hypothetical protein
MSGGEAQSELMLAAVRFSVIFLNWSRFGAGMLSLLRSCNDLELKALFEDDFGRAYSSELGVNFPKLQDLFFSRVLHCDDLVEASIGVPLLPGRQQKNDRRPC